MLALPFLIPLSLFIALLIRSVSTGPVLFRQERVGHQGRRFMCFKFRTMFVDADTATHQGHLHQLMNSDKPMMKMDSKGDPRIIPFGVLLRASGFDELPQLINVLRGEMSLVGPRPCLPYDTTGFALAEGRFGDGAGFDRALAGGRKNKTTFVEIIQLDIKYTKNKNLSWDLKIIILTTFRPWPSKCWRRVRPGGPPPVPLAGQPVIPMAPPGRIPLRKHWQVRFRPEMAKRSG